MFTFRTPHPLRAALALALTSSAGFGLVGCNAQPSSEPASQPPPPTPAALPQTPTASTPSPEASPASEYKTSDKLTTDQLKQYAGEPGVAKLSWTTQSEEDNFGYLIMRSQSPDGKFQRINPTIMQGAGNTSTPHDYTFYDLQVKVGETYYYQISSISMSGQIAPFSEEPLKFTVKRRYLGGDPPGSTNLHDPVPEEPAGDAQPTTASAATTQTSATP